MLLSKSKKSEYTKNILTLITGTGIAQLVPIVVSPILTRLYSPEDFGLLALYLSLVSICTVLCTCRYEMAIMLPEKNSDVNSIIKLLVLVTLISSFVIFLFLFFYSFEVAAFFGNRELSSLIIYLPLSIVLTALFQALNYLLIRDSHFERLAKNKVISSTSNASVQLGFGYTINSSWGLFFGHLASLFVSIFIIFRSKKVNHYFIFKRAKARAAAKEHQKFPRYDMPAILLNLFANQIPLLVLGKFFGLSVLGAYSFMYKTLMMPVGLISNSVLDVFKNKATEDYSKEGTCVVVYIETLKKLIYLGLPIFIFLGFYSPNLFAFVFGEQWRLAGQFAQYMAPMFFFNFIANPLSYTFFIAGKQSVNLKGQTLILLCSVLSALIGYYVSNVTVFIIVFSALNSLIYMLYIYLSYSYSRGKNAI